MNAIIVALEQGRILKPDCIIIGGGVIGYSTAHRLALAGMMIRLIEQSHAGQESSWAGGGILYPLLPWDYSEAVSQLAQQSIDLFSDWVKELHTSSKIDPEYQCCGMLVLPPFSTHKARVWSSTHATRLEITRTQKIAQELATDEDALWLPEVAQVRNPRLLKALRRRLEQLGVEIMEHTKVTGWKNDGSRITAIETNRGAMKAEDYIVTSGAWSRQLLGEFAPDLDIRPIRGQMLLFEAEPGALRTIILRNGIYLIPRLDGLILVGSTLEDVGFDKTTTEEAKAMLHAQATEILPLLKEAPLVRHWSGLRPGSPDNIPTIDRHPQLENLYINSGHFRYGVTMAPASAEIMTNLILGRSQAMDITPYHWPANMA